jgi:mRNA-degrading endonuclease YafQ of YafQ-DinJ toxin-antitoxin module
VKITYSNSFKKSFKNKIKNNPELEEKFWNKVELFLKDPYHPNLKTHKLTGELRQN